MGKEIYYRQCGYEQACPPEGRGRKFDVAYLPEKLAKVGQVFYLGKKRKDVRPEEKWQVTWVSDVRRTAEWINFKRNADQQQRKTSDA